MYFCISDPGFMKLQSRNTQCVLARPVLFATYTRLLNHSLITPFSKSRDSIAPNVIDPVTSYPISWSRDLGKLVDRLHAALFMSDL